MVRFTSGATFDHWVDKALLLIVHMSEQLCDSNMVTIIVLLLIDMRVHNLLIGS
jgi:hypothetical protein